MARTKHFVLEEKPSGAFNEYDVVCPSCGNVVKETQTKGRRISTKCSDCSAWVCEYSAIAVETGRADELTQKTMERTLKDYWEFESDDRRDDFREAARDLRMGYLFESSKQTAYL